MTKTNKVKVTITIDSSVYDKLPKKNKSSSINEILKTHYQKEGFEQLYQMIKKKLLKDKDINDWIVASVGEVKYD